jgi:uncharacterized protein YggE
MNAKRAHKERNMKANWKIICSALGVLAIAGAVVLYGNFKEPRKISVSGECLTTAPKDRAAITLRVMTLDKSAAASMKTASAKMTEITAYLKTLDVQLQTTQFDSYEKTEWNRDAQKSETVGMETNIAVEVSAKNTEIIEKILTQFAGTPNVYSENLHMFTSAETLKPILEKCLGDAVANARERASAIAAADGGKIGKMIAAEYADSPVRPVMSANVLRSAKMETAADAAYIVGGLASKDTDVSVSVSATFEAR